MLLFEKFCKVIRYQAQQRQQFNLYALKELQKVCAEVYYPKFSV